MYNHRPAGSPFGDKFSKYRVFVLNESIPKLFNVFPKAFPSNYHNNCPPNYVEYSVPSRSPISCSYFYSKLISVMHINEFIIPSQHNACKKWSS